MTMSRILVFLFIQNTKKKNGMEQQLCLFRGQNEAIFKNKQQRKNTSKSVHLKYIKKKKKFPIDANSPHCKRKQTGISTNVTAILKQTNKHKKKTDKNDLLGH